MRYQVPQFIEVEDKIFGPLTLKQFLYVAGGASISFMIWTILPRFFAIPLIIPVAIFFLALAFYKVNDRPFLISVENGLKYLTKSKLYIWKREEKMPQKKKATEKENSDVELFIPKLSDSKLKRITWSLDINENIDNLE